MADLERNDPKSVRPSKQQQHQHLLTYRILRHYRSHLSKLIELRRHKSQGNHSRRCMILESHHVYDKNRPGKLMDFHFTHTQESIRRWVVVAAALKARLRLGFGDLSIYFGKQLLNRYLTSVDNTKITCENHSEMY